MKIQLFLWDPSKPQEVGHLWFSVKRKYDIFSDKSKKLNISNDQTFEKLLNAQYV